MKEYIDEEMKALSGCKDKFQEVVFDGTKS
jgi:hypothetical protein